MSGWLPGPKSNCHNLNVNMLFSSLTLENRVARRTQGQLHLRFSLIYMEV